MKPGGLGSLITISLMCAMPALAQPAGYLYGYITDPSSAAVAGATVSVVNEDNGFRRVTQSQPDGEFAVPSLASGAYSVTVRKDGFRSMVRFHVRLDSATPARADFALILGSVLETITVEGTAPLLEREDAAVLTLFEQDRIAKLPLNGRGMLGLMELAPGVNAVPATRGDAGQFVSSGQRPNTNYFSIDGISANNGVTAGGLPAQASGGSLPMMSAFGSFDSLLTLDAIQEMRVESSSSPSEFGRLPGAAIAVSTRAGSDELHGSASFGFRHEDLSANDWFANRMGESRPILREEDTDATLGGSLIRNRTFFFLSYKHLSLRQPYTWMEAVPSAAARAGAPDWALPALALFPIANGPSLGKGLAQWNGQSSRPGALTAGSARIDQAVTSHVTAFARYSDSPSTNEFGITQVNRLDFRSGSGTVGLTARAGADTVFDFRVNQSVSSASSVWSGNAGCELLPIAKTFMSAAPSCDLLVRFSINGVGQLISGREGDRRQKQFQIVTSAAFRSGSHTPRMGADYRRIVPIRRDSGSTLSLIADSLSALDNTGSFWVGRALPHSGSTFVRELSLWAHDTWRPSQRFTLMTGLRWEYSPAPQPPGIFFLNPNTQSVETQDRPLWPHPYGHFAPRLGMAIRPRKNGSTVIRAGAGLYYDSSLSIATDAINSGPLNIDFYSGRFAPFSGLLTYGFLPNLVLPRVAQWNLSVERAMTKNDLLSVSYVGAAGYNLIRREVGGPGSTPTAWFALTTNHGASNYQSFQAQYQRRVARGLEGHISYAWSHSLDNDSSDSFLLWAGTSSPASRDHASSDFDLRHSLSASFSYRLPGRLQGWYLDSIFQARTGFPITVLQAEQYTGIAFGNAFRPDLVGNVPVWIADPNAPGGQYLNPQAFHTPKPGTQGNLGRNALSGFGMTQLDLAARREFRIADRRTIELRLQAFNALNHANFADPVKYLNSPYFGQSTSMLNMMLGTGSPGSGLSPLLQSGGPRSVEAVLRFRF